LSLKEKVLNDVKNFWDQKFAQSEYLYGKEPNAYVAQKSALLKESAEILCLGEGEGRNALFLAQNGHNVSAIDISSEAMKKAQALFSRYNYSIDFQLQDLLTWQSPEACYDGAIVTYLHLHKEGFKKVLASTLRALKKDAYYIGEFFSDKQLALNSGGPKSLEMLYTLDEMREYFEDEDVEIIELDERIAHLSEGAGHSGEAWVIRVVAKK
jgi:SAM-dependent methyltransferase